MTDLFVAALEYISFCHNSVQINPGSCRSLANWFLKDVSALSERILQSLFKELDESSCHDLELLSLGGRGSMRRLTQCLSFITVSATALKCTFNLKLTVVLTSPAPDQHCLMLHRLVQVQCRSLGQLHLSSTGSSPSQLRSITAQIRQNVSHCRR